MKKILITLWIFSCLSKAQVTSVPSSAGGSGATSISGLTDLKVSISTNVATLAAGKVTCGATSYSVSTTTFTLSSGSATSYIGFNCADAGGTPVTLARGANTMSGVSGYTDSSATNLSGFPNIIPLASITISGSNWLAVTDLRTIGGLGGLAANTNISIDTDANGIVRVGTTSALSATVIRPAISTVTFSATPTFDLSLGNTLKITLTGNVTSSTVSNQTAGQDTTFIICQDGTGSRTFAWPATMRGETTIGSTASLCTAQTFRSDGTDLFATGAGVTNQ